jgi:hypothetical protein
VGPTSQPLRRLVSHPNWPSWVALPVATRAGIKTSSLQCQSEPFPVRAPPSSGPSTPPVTAISAPVSHDRCAAAAISSCHTTTAHSSRFSAQVAVPESHRSHRLSVVLLRHRGRPGSTQAKPPSNLAIESVSAAGTIPSPSPSAHTSMCYRWSASSRCQHRRRELKIDFAADFLFLDRSTSLRNFEDRLRC